MNQRPRLAAALSLLALSACGDPSSSEAASGALQIAVVPKGTTHEFWKSVHAGAEAAARDLGVEVIWKGPIREDDRAEQIQIVENFVVRGVDGIVLMPMDRKALVTPAEEAGGQGIPVVVADSDLDWEGRTSFVATDNRRGGELAGEALAERLQEFKKRGVHVLGSFIFGLPSDKPATFDATVALAQQAADLGLGLGGVLAVAHAHEDRADRARVGARTPIAATTRAAWS